jgi:hypothetical protein
MGAMDTIMSRPKSLGAYAPLSAAYYKDDSLAEAGEAAELLYVRGLAFCAEMVSDGFITDLQVVRFVGVGMKDATKRAKRLVDVTLWDRVEGGYVVTSWLKWNRTSEEIGRAKQRDRERKVPKDAGQTVALPDAEPPFQPDSERIPSGFQPDSERIPPTTPNGFQPDSSLAREGACGIQIRSDQIRSEEPSCPPSAPPRVDVERLCERLTELMIGNGSKPPTITKAWRQDARLLLDRDRRPLAEALSLLAWSQSDPFWKSNIQSIAKFRHHYDRLRIKAEQAGKLEQSNQARAKLPEAWL